MGTTTGTNVSMTTVFKQSNFTLKEDRQIIDYMLELTKGLNGPLKIYKIWTSLKNRVDSPRPANQLGIRFHHALANQMLEGYDDIPFLDKLRTVFALGCIISDTNIQKLRTVSEKFELDEDKRTVYCKLGDFVFSALDIHGTSLLRRRRRQKGSTDGNDPKKAKTSGGETGGNEQDEDEDDDIIFDGPHDFFPRSPQNQTSSSYLNVKQETSGYYEYYPSISTSLKNVIPLQIPVTNYPTSSGTPAVVDSSGVYSHQCNTTVGSNSGVVETTCGIRSKDFMKMLRGILIFLNSEKLKDVQTKVEAAIATFSDFDTISNEKVRPAFETLLAMATSNSLTSGACDEQTALKSYLKFIRFSLITMENSESVTGTLELIDNSIKNVEDRFAEVPISNIRLAIEIAFAICSR